MPGRVLISRNQGSPSAVRMKSAREYTDRPRVSYTRRAAARTFSSSAGVISDGQTSSAAPGWYLFS